MVRFEKVTCPRHPNGSTSENEIARRGRERAKAAGPKVFQKKLRRFPVLRKRREFKRREQPPKHTKARKKSGERRRKSKLRDLKFLTNFEILCKFEIFDERFEIFDKFEILDLQSLRFQNLVLGFMTQNLCF